jgi:glucarate dehydratase
MLLSLRGAHGPFFTRNVVILRDSAGNTGAGEVTGGEKIRSALERVKPLVQGSSLGEYKNTLQKLETLLSGDAGDFRDSQGLDSSAAVYAIAAVEAPLLDLLGKHLKVPAAALLGEGQQRKRVEILGRLSFIGDRDKTGLPYAAEASPVEWYRLRRQQAQTPEAVAALARASRKKYGFSDFKITGGVFEGAREMETVKALKEAFPAGRISLTAAGAWTLREAVSLCAGMDGVLYYCEDPCGAEGGFSGREVMAEFRRATGLSTAANMIASGWRQLAHAAVLHAVDIPLTDPHCWTMEGAVQVGRLCQTLGLTWGSCSESHFDISLAMIIQTAAAVPGRIAALDTHWIWQEGTERLTVKPPEIREGCIEVPKVPGLGIEVDMKKLRAAHELYVENRLGGRDDAAAMQFLIPGWRFHPKRPSMVR